MKYIAEFELKLASAIKEVGDLENSINKYMSEFGYNEKLSISTKIFNIEISVEQELDDKAKYKTEALLKSFIIESMPNYDIRLKSFSRQSEQLVEQSAE